MKQLTFAILAFLSVGSYAEERLFSGTYTEGFEWSYFIECGSSEKLWIEYSPAVLELKKALESDGVRFSYHLGDQNPMVPVRLKGNLSKEGKWGHLGQYKHQLNVTQYISHGSAAGAECKI
ncbi:MAG: hypothetical protein ACK4ML_07560 [Alishewanella aestuarii]